MELTVPVVGAGLCICVAVLVLWCLLLRVLWRRQSAEVVRTMDTPPEVLAEQHPIALRDKLRAAREVEAILASYCHDPRVSPGDLEKAKQQLHLAEQAVDRVHEAIEASVARRAGRGLTVPSSGGAKHIAEVSEKAVSGKEADAHATRV